MAAGGGGGGETVRLRLLFDYPPPAAPRCSVSWLLADLGQCRVVTDLASLIRHRFGFSAGAALGLYLDGGLLPPAESARLVRDNDCLRVKLEEVEVAEGSLAVSNGFRHPAKKTKKRHRSRLEEEESEEGAEDQNRAKRLKGPGGCPGPSEGKPVDDPGPRKKLRQKERRERRGQNGTAGDEGRAGGREQNKRKLGKEKEAEAEGKGKRQKKTVPLPAGVSGLLKGHPPAAAKKKLGKRCPAKPSPDSSSGSSSGSDSSDSSSDEGGPEGQKGPEQPAAPTPKRGQARPPEPGPGAEKAGGSGSRSARARGIGASDSGSEGKKRKSPQAAPAGAALSQGPPEEASPSPDADRHSPAPPESARFAGGPDPLGVGYCARRPPGPAPGLGGLGRGRARGEDLFPWRGARDRGFRGMSRGRGRGEGYRGFPGGGAESQKQQQLTEVAANSSIVIQNAVEAPRRDYSVLPLLGSVPPQVGTKIAFKVLELTENYTPAVSSFKEGRIVSYNPDSSEIDIEVLSSSPVAKEPGKFDLVYQNENGTEVVEYAVSQDQRITKRWEGILEPRLIIEPTPSGPPSADPAQT
ncbi:coilin isoform X2 [Tachyglossus aculeatus]|uniref:coilin isoform X2 n=1 Tax=Tachyglossus aculeatus TaxID=9261 RepID=UPI0018F47361|nr:coilin isoform X2 [Tachyglossus aculeatus]